MIPNDPESPATRNQPPAADNQQPETRNQKPFWTYLDLAFFISLLLPSLFLAALIVKVDVAHSSATANRSRHCWPS